jgi:prevent-host-death family protein
MSVKQINATEARNNFFSLLKQSYLGQQTYLVKKGDIPMVYIVPVNHGNLEQAMLEKEKQMDILQQASKLRESISEGSDSVKMIREMRRYGR